MNTCKAKEKLYKLQRDEIELLGNGNDYVRGIHKGICLSIDAVEDHNDWIPVSEGLPQEHNSAFATSKYNGHWCEGMFMKVSDKVNVTIEFEDGKRNSDTSYTQDGVWLIEKQHKAKKCKVISWQPLPKQDERINYVD